MTTHCNARFMYSPCTRETLASTLTVDPATEQGKAMAGKANEANVLPLNSLSVMRAGVRDGASESEWRIDGERGLVLRCQSSGAATWWFIYSMRIGGVRKLRRMQIGRRDGVTLADARKAAIELRRRVEDGGDPVAETKAHNEALTFQAMAERFIDESPRLSTKTRPIYRSALKKDAYPFIGALPAADVTREHVLHICRRIEARAKASGRGTGVQSQRTKTTISGAYSWAIGEGLVAGNPCDGIGRRSVTVARTRNPSSAELAALWHTAATPKGKLSRSVSLIIRLAILTGQRRDEVAGCRTIELVGLDTDMPLWVIPGDENKRGKIIEGRTKNGREQRLPLSRQAVGLFREALTECSQGGEFLFPADLTKIKIGRTPRAPHIHGESVTMAMRRLRAAAGVDDVSVHDMRRAISNWMKDQGIGREVRDLALNHLDGSVDARHYSGSARMEIQVRAAMQAWADHVSQIVEQAQAQSAQLASLEC